MRYYVTLIDSQVVHLPKVLENSESSSPNTNWSKQQMLLNNFVEVDISHNPEVEYIDLQNPQVSGNNVTYNRIQHSSTEKLNKAKSKKIGLIKSTAKKIILDKYSEFELSMTAMNLGSLVTQIGNDCSLIISNRDTMISEVNALTTEESVSSYAINFPSI